MKRLFIGLLAVCFAVSLLFWTVLPVGAQEDTGDVVEGEFTLEEITVTAEKREQPTQSVARSLAVITADDIVERQATNVQDMLMSTAGISFQGFYNQIAIRGVGIGGAQANDDGYEPSVQFNVDGNLSLHTSGGTSTMFQAMTDVERVEVIRGPSGAINGRMAAAGSINIVTRDPDFEKIDGNASITVGDYDTLNMNAAMNLPLPLTGLDLPGDLENLSFRLAFAKNEHSAYIHNENDEDVSGSQDAVMGRVKMKWQPVDRFILNGLFSYTKDESNSTMEVPPINTQQTFPPGAAGPHPDDPWLYEGQDAEDEGDIDTKKNYTESLEAIYSADFATFTAKWSKSWQPEDCDSDTNQQGGVCYEGDRYQKDIELRISSPDDSKYKWMIGANKYHKKEYPGPDEEVTQIDMDNVSIPFSNFYGDANWFRQVGIDVESEDFDANDPARSWMIEGVTPITSDSAVFISSDATRPIDSYSYFANITIPLFEDRHRATFGVRQSVEKKKRAATYAIFTFDDSHLDTEGNPIPHFRFDDDDGDGTGTWECDNCVLEYTEDPQIMETDDKPVNISVGWEYDWKSDVMLYANVNSGFKPGGISSEGVPNTYYEPETVITYAAGVKSRLFGNQLELNVEAFVMDYDNLQLDMNSFSEVTFTAGNGETYVQSYMFNKKIVNVGRTINKGISVDYEWLITYKDRLSGNFEYKDNKYGELVYHLGANAMPPGAPEWISLKGRQMPFAPKFTFYGGYSHIFSFGNYSLTPRFDIHYSTKYPVFSEYWWEEAGVETVQSAYWKYDAYINFGPANGFWQLNAYCKNISEEAILSLGMMTTNVQEPRTMGVGLTYKF